MGGRRAGPSPLLVGGLLLAAVTVVVAGVALLGGFGGGLLSRQPTPQEAVAAVADEWFAAWAEEDWARLQGLVADPSVDAAAVHEQVDEAVRISAARFVAGEPVVEGDVATVPFTATWEIEGFGPYEYDSTLPLERHADTVSASPSPSPTADWRVDWAYSIVHPHHGAERRFERVRTFPPRAPILAADGSPLAVTGEVVAVGVAPGRVTDAHVVADALAAHAGADPQAVLALLARDDLVAEFFYPVVELARPEFEAVRPALEPVPGVVFRAQQGRVNPVPELATALLGRTAEITAEQLDTLGEPYQVGDVVGRSGLEATYERQLAGEPERELRVVDDEGVVRTLMFVEATAPQPLRTTLSIPVQQAAEAALAGVADPAAIVAVDPATGAVRAAASKAEDGVDRALAARFPPGSTFKIVTAAALLANGWTPETIVECPEVVTLGGRAVTNAGDIGLGPVPLAEATAVSCNTAFAGEAVELGAGPLVATAETFGFNADYDVGLPAAGGSFPQPDDVAELAAAAFGQARVTASPLHMATVAAAAQSGTWRSPSLLTGAAPEERSLPPGAVAPLQTLLRGVVSSGTGTAADVPGSAVSGKTGSAEFGTGPPPLPTHAWFAGYREGLAFAVFVEGGGGGGSVAAPLAAQFLTALPAA